MLTVSEAEAAGMDSLGRIPTGASAGADEQVEGGRTRKRDSLFLSARLTFEGSPATHDVRIRNLSEGGLMAEYEPPVATGVAVTLAMRGLGELTGRVAWCTRGRLGIAFDHPIDPTRARKPVGTGSTTPAFAKPIIISARRR